jgi:hypothetical protein
MIRALNLLRSGLDQAFEGVRQPLADWAEPQLMARTLAEVRRQHDRPEARSIEQSTIAMAVAAFRRSGELPRFTDLKYVCLGAASVDRDGRCLLAEEELRDRLLMAAETISEPRRQLKCFQGLLRSYWSFPLNDSHVPEPAHRGLTVLRAWLARRFIALDQSRMHKPEWFVMLSLHAHLLSDQPCDRYIPALLEGKGDALQLAVDDLAIPSDSWVMEEAVLAAIRSAVALGDDEFKGALPRLLAISFGLAGVSVSAPLSMRCVAQLLSRHARCASVSIHLQLFDAALSIIGNPWLRRATWEVHVIDERGRPDELAREMVGAWLKHRLISDFFQIFGEDAAGDKRRLDYWLRIEPFIQDMWFGLAVNAGGRAEQRYDDFVRRAEGRLLDLVGTEHPVLLMRIGDFVALESGAQGQPFTLFRWDGLATDLIRTLSHGQASLSVQALKSAKIEARLEHRDSPERGSSWEQKFDEHIRPIIWQAP